MKKIITILFFIGALVALVLFLQFSGKERERVTVTEPTSVILPAIIGEDSGEINVFESERDREDETVRTEKDTIVSFSVGGETILVTRVIDGDTIEIETGEKVRYIGVNTPESVDPRKTVQCFGKEASAYNKELVLGKRVRLEADVEDRDKYGRLLRYVWIGDEMMNERLVADGYAQLMTIPPNVKYVERFKSAQTEAREAKRGLWSTCKKGA